MKITRKEHKQREKLEVGEMRKEEKKNLINIFMTSRLERTGKKDKILRISTLWS